MNNIVIHGASSFLGKSFINSLLTKNINILIVARSTSQIQNYESSPNITVIRYNKSISEIDCQRLQATYPTFFDFSWNGVFGTDRNTPEQFTVNIPLIISSIEFATKLGVKHWIGVGSQAEYGSSKNIITEDDICNPTTMYGKSKLICSKISSELCEAYNIEHSWLRLFSVYGPNDNHDWLIPYLIKEMLMDKDINVTKGEQIWDYLYIDDVSEVLFKLMHAKGVGIANLGSGQPIVIKDLIKKIKSLTNSNSNINFGAIDYRSDQVMSMLPNISKLKTHLNWEPKINLEIGLKDTIKSFKVLAR